MLKPNFEEADGLGICQIQFTVAKSLIFWQSWSSGILDTVSTFSKMAPPSNTSEEFDETGVNLEFSWSFVILIEQCLDSDLHFRILSIAWPHF